MAPSSEKKSGLPKAAAIMSSMLSAWRMALRTATFLLAPSAVTENEDRITEGLQHHRLRRGRPLDLVEGFNRDGIHG